MTAVSSRRAVREAQLDLAVVAFAVFLGGALCAIELGRRSIWLDEGATIAISSQHGAALWHGIAHDGGNMLAYYLMMHFVIAWFGEATWVIRLPSLMADAITGGLVAVIALRLFGNRRLAVVACLLTSISLPLVYWSQNARGYSLMVMFITATFLPLIAILQTPPGRPAPRGSVVAYVLLTVAALYVGYDAVLLIPAQLALLYVFRERARVVIGSMIVTLVLCLPLAVLAVHRGSGQLFWVPHLSAKIVRQSTVTMLSAGLAPTFQYNFTTIVTAVLSGIVLIAGLVAAGRASLPQDSRLRQWRMLLILSWIVVPSVLSLLIALVGQPIELQRCTVLVMPAVALLFAWALLHQRIARWLGLGVLAAVLALRAVQLVPSYGDSPEDWKAATHYVLADLSSTKSDCVVFYPKDGREPFDYYLMASGDARLASRLDPLMPTLAWGRVKPYVEDYGTLTETQYAALPSHCARVWLLSSHQGMKRGPGQSERNYSRYLAINGELAEEYPHFTLRQFGWSAPVDVEMFSK